MEARGRPDKTGMLMLRLSQDKEQAKIQTATPYGPLMRFAEFALEDGQPVQAKEWQLLLSSAGRVG